MWMECPSHTDLLEHDNTSGPLLLDMLSNRQATWAVHVLIVKYMFPPLLEMTRFVTRFVRVGTLFVEIKITIR